MTPHDGDSAATLAVDVRPGVGLATLATRSTSLYERRVALVRALIASAGGNEVGAPTIDACFGFGSWTTAVDAAIELATRTQHLTTPLAGMEVGIGLDLSYGPDDQVASHRAAAIARSAGPNEIRLGEAVAAQLRLDPPDRSVVRPVQGDPAFDGEAVHRLANAIEEVASNLVPAPTSFVGREAEIDAVRRLLGKTRLVTVTGPPGAGKTRLATEIAARMLGRYADGAWFVGLAPISDPRLMLPTLADALGLARATDQSVIDAVVSHIRTRHLLVVLDNFEHVTDAARELATLVALAPRLELLVTSRTALHLSGEHEYPLPPLGLPPRDAGATELGRSEAVDLFTRRAGASQPAFRLSEENASQVGDLCRRLDGLPLAIELAAARVKLLPLSAILARLDHRLALLTGGPRDLPARHQSLRAAVAWSYDLLVPSTQALFRRLSVFRGGWTIDGAVAVCGAGASRQDEVLETLAALLDASLLVRHGPDSELPRYTMLETLREFAAERLDEADEANLVRTRHAAFFLDIVERDKPLFTGPDPGAALDRVGVEHDNVRAALDFLLKTEPEDALRLGAAMWRFWQMRGHLLEGGRWLTDALEATTGSDSEELRAEASAAIGSLAYWRGDMAAARPYYEEAVAIRRRIGDPLPMAEALYDLAFVFAPYFFPPPEDPTRTAQGSRLLQEAEGLFREAGNEPGIAKSAWMSGNLMLFQDAARATSVLGDSVARFRRLNDPFGLGWALRTYGCALLGIADSAAASGAFSEALRLFAAARDGSALGLLLSDFADVARLEGDGVRAARLKGAAAGLRQATEAGLFNVEDVPWLVDAPALEGLIDAAGLERAEGEGRAMSQGEAIAYALGADAVGQPDAALRVIALGSFRVERFGQPVTHWGGPKAGSRQAQAMFAFLLDRGERGVIKDEFIEVIWPDAEVAQGDLNFHRTLGGLRSTLEPNKVSGPGGAVLFANGRYRLSPSVIGWQDVAEFEQRLLHASRATDDVAATRGLEAARSLYGGDYLDDCPLYGDSEYVEDRRRFLRGRMTDALVDLGRRYETRGQETLAAERFREALTTSGGDCPSATAGLKVA
jgi:predicted ATPase/DNA-binding SARP family transcriptional activator